MIALLADPLVWVLLGLVTAPRALIRALRSPKATPLDALLGRIPWPGRRKRRAVTQGWRLSDAPDRRRSGRPVNGPQTPRKDRPCTTAASTAATAASRTASGAPKAATTTSPATRTADFLTAPLRLRHATGQHAAALTLRFGSDGLLRHGEDATGPMPALMWDASTPFPRALHPEVTR